MYQDLKALLDGTLDDTGSESADDDEGATTGASDGKGTLAGGVSTGAQSKVRITPTRTSGSAKKVIRSNASKRKLTTRR